MTAPGRSRGNRLLLCVVALSALVFLTVPPAALAARAQSWDVGIGSTAASDGPLCDAATGNIRIPSLLAPPCVRAWDKAKDNGGATSQGVTKDSIKLVVFVPPTDQQLHPASTTGSPKNRSTGGIGLFQDAVLDAQRAFDGRFETYGRKIEWDYVESSGTDEAAQRADALKVANMKPFAVVSIFGGDVFTSTLAKRHVIVAWSIVGGAKGDLAQQPYLYEGQDPNLLGANVAKFVGLKLSGKKAEWAGDPNVHAQQRKFGVIYEQTAVGGNEFDMTLFQRQLRASGVRNPVEVVALDLPADTAQAASTAQEQAPTLVTKLKSAGVTTVILLTGYSEIPAITKAATSQDFSPEWVTTGWNYHDLGLFGPSYDPEQWKHAFGLAWVPPYTASAAGAGTLDNVVDWYWGKNAGTTSPGATPGVFYVNEAVHLAGPKLTPKTYSKALLSLPGRGGAFEGLVTIQGHKLGDVGLGYPEYALLAQQDFALVWWDPTARGLGSIVGNQQTSGNYRYLDGGKRYALLGWKKGNPKFFEDVPTSVTDYTTPPPKDVPPTYVCDGCPSQGGSQTPSQLHPA